MGKKKKVEELSVEDLRALQAKVLNNEPLSEEEKAKLSAAEQAQKEADDEAEQAAEKARLDAERAAEEEDTMDRLATLIAKKLARGATVDGGKPHVPLTPKEVKNLPKQTQDERAEEYFKATDLETFPWPGIHVTSDLQVFLGNTQGENALANHIASSVVNGAPTITHKSFSKPE